MLAGLPAVGCGSDSSEASLDKATFIKRADAICKKTGGRLAAETRALNERELAASASQVEMVNAIIKQVVVPGLELELEEIRALGQPDEGSQQIRTYLSSLEKALVFARSKPALLANAESPPYDAAEIAGRKFGLTACPVMPVTAN